MKESERSELDVPPACAAIRPVWGTTPATMSTTVRADAVGGMPPNAEYIATASSQQQQHRYEATDNHDAPGCKCD